MHSHGNNIVGESRNYIVGESLIARKITLHEQSKESAMIIKVVLSKG